MPDTPRLYDDLAHLWPHLSPPEHYEAEAASLCELIDETLGEPPLGRKWSVLELGAGGGHTLVHLKDRYDCAAVDLSPAMLEQFKRLNPGVPATIGDMRDVRLGKTFDVVLIHDAIDYMTTPDDAQRAIDTAAAHLRPGGLALIAPTYARETFVDGDVADDGTTIPGIAGDDDLTYFSFVHDPDPSDSTFEMILLYLLRDSGTRFVKVVEDRHTCGLFAIADWEAMMRAAGFEVQILAELGNSEDPDQPAAWAVLLHGVRA